MKEDSFRLKDNFLFEKLPNIIIPNFQQDNDDISIFTQSIADSIEKEIEFLIDYIEVAGNKNLTDKEIQFEDFIEDKNNEEQAFGPKIEFDNIKHDNSFDSLEYDLCFELKSQIFYSVLNEEENRTSYPVFIVSFVNARTNRSFTMSSLHKTETRKIRIN